MSCTKGMHKGTVNKLLEVLLDATGRLITTPGEAQINASVLNVHAIPTGTSTRYALPTAGGVFEIHARGGAAYFKGGDVTVTCTTSDYRGFVPEGGTFGPYKFPAAVTHVAVIGAVAVGDLVFVEIKPQ